MKRLPLYAEEVERWAIVSSGRPAFGDSLVGRRPGRIVNLPDGTVRYQRAADSYRPAVDELVEIRAFSHIFYASVDETGDEPVLRVGHCWKIVPQ